MQKSKIVFAVLVFSLITSNVAFAQMGPGMMTSHNAVTDDGHTAREEAEGKIVWEKLQAQQASCADLTDEDFGVLGEYFMGQMLGSAHAAMNQMMMQMMGEEGEEAMHVVLGKWLSGCDTNVAFPAGGTGFIPMMQMMMGGGMNQSGVFGSPWGIKNFMMYQGGWQTPFDFGPGGVSGRMSWLFWLLIPLLIWSLAWKGLALWKAAERKELPWFIALLVINTAGLLEIFYIFVIAKKGKEHHEKQG